MIKASAKGRDGRSYLIIGLSHANLDKLRSDGTGGFIKILGAEMKLPIDVIITAGENETTLAHELAEFIGPDTEVHIAEKLKQ
jgi:hypothetical protein